MDRIAKVVVLGGGGREHAIGSKLALSPEVSEVLYAPGNAGTALEDKGSNAYNRRNEPLACKSTEDFPEVLDLISRESIDLAVVGPENLLELGLVDYLNANGYHRVFGPTQAAAKVETDKFLSYSWMSSANIPQAYSEKCGSVREAMAKLSRWPTEAIVVKAKGLASGKGVIVCDSKDQADKAIKKIAELYGQEILLAERLTGPEVSLFTLCDGKNAVPFLCSVQDHKPVFDNDHGSNTGGMGAYGPVPLAPADTIIDLSEKIVGRLISKMAMCGIEYRGFLYTGLMMTAQGPKVLEFNARLGDPEAQVLMMLLKTDLYQAISMALDQKLKGFDLEFYPGAACCVVMASPGYPDKYKTGMPISGLEQVAAMPGVKVFHSGTAFDENRRIVTAGGRVVGVTATGPDLRAAIELAYQAVPLIKFEGGSHYRHDIGAKALRAE